MMALVSDGRLEAGLTCPANSYWGSGFTTLQYLLGRLWLRQRKSSLAMPTLKIRQLPKKAYKGYSATVMTVFRSMVPLYITMSMSMFISPMLTVIVDEKEKRIKETLKMKPSREENSKKHPKSAIAGPARVRPYGQRPEERSPRL